MVALVSDEAWIDVGDVVHEAWFAARPATPQVAAYQIGRLVNALWWLHAAHELSGGGRIELSGRLADPSASIDAVVDRLVEVGTHLEDCCDTHGFVSTVVSQKCEWYDGDSYCVAQPEFLTFDVLGALAASGGDRPFVFYPGNEETMFLSVGGLRSSLLMHTDGVAGIGAAFDLGVLADQLVRGAIDLHDDIADVAVVLLNWVPRIRVRRDGAGRETRTRWRPDVALHEVPPPLRRYVVGRECVECVQVDDDDVRFVDRLDELKAQAYERLATLRRSEMPLAPGRWDGFAPRVLGHCDAIGVRPADRRAIAAWCAEEIRSGRPDALDEILRPAVSRATARRTHRHDTATESLAITIESLLPEILRDGLLTRDRVARILREHGHGADTNRLGAAIELVRSRNGLPPVRRGRKGRAPSPPAPARG